MGDNIGKVLIVEDDFTRKIKLAEVLSSEGFAVASAAAKDGDAAIPKIIAAKPKIIITDVVTANPDSPLTFIEKIKRHPELKGVEIFLYTQTIDVSLEVGLRRLKLTEYFTKEKNPAHIVAAVKRYFGVELDEIKFKAEAVKKKAEVEAKRRAEEQAELEAKKSAQQRLEEEAAARQKMEAEAAQEAKKRDQQRLEEEAAKRRDEAEADVAKQKAELEAELEAKKREQ